MAGQRKLVQVGVGSLAVQALAQVAAALGDEKVAQVIGRRVVWRAAMEARRAGTETGEVQEAQHGEGQIQRQKGECESDRTEVRGPLWDRSGLWVGRETEGGRGGSDVQMVGHRWLVRTLVAGRRRVD